MVWWLVGAAVAALISLPCGINLGMRISRGDERPWAMSVLPWAFGLHGLFGFVALVMISRAVG